MGAETVTTAPAAALAGVTCRAETAADAEQVRAIYASTRAPEMALVDWTAEQKQEFLRMQFDAQRRSYASAFPDARFEVIERAGRVIGRLYVHHRDHDVRIVDIALLPDARRQGIGTALVRDVITRAERLQQHVSVHVEQENPARRLYERLGFRPVEERGLYLLMERAPGAGTGM